MTTQSERTGPSPIELAEDFLEFCKKYPDQRFWQALRNWAGVPYIFAGVEKKFDTTLVDTFYTNKRNPL